MRSSEQVGANYPGKGASVSQALLWEPSVGNCFILSGYSNLLFCLACCFSDRQQLRSPLAGNASFKWLILPVRHSSRLLLMLVDADLRASPVFPGRSHVSWWLSCSFFCKSSVHLILLTFNIAGGSRRFWPREDLLSCFYCTAMIFVLLL